MIIKPFARGGGNRIVIYPNICLGDINVNMGLFEKLFGHKTKDVKGSPFVTMTEFSPSFSSYQGNIYEQELTRSAIDRIATGCSKLKLEVEGTSNKMILKNLKHAPNSFQTWTQFLYRTATILECDTTAYVSLVFERDGVTPSGITCLKPLRTEIVEYMGEPWVRFYFANGEISVLKLSEVCVLTKFQYNSDIYGTENCLEQTMQLIHAQTEAQKSAIKNGAKIRFIGSLTGQVREEDIEAKRKRFINSNLSNENDYGIILYDQTFNSVSQVEPQEYTMSSSEMERIENNVFNYFGVNKEIMQNNYDENSWGSFYEGKIEPFAIQLADALTNIVLTRRERMAGNKISFSSNRLSYATNASKRNMIRDMLDRGIYSMNEAREVLQLPPIEDGDIRVIRGEYVNAAAVSKAVYLDREKSDGDRDEYKTDNEVHGGAEAGEVDAY